MDIKSLTKQKKLIIGGISLLICVGLILSYVFIFNKNDSSDKKTKKNDESVIETMTLRERLDKFSKANEILFEDYSSYYADNKDIQSCFMATSKNIMYSYMEYVDENAAKDIFNSGMENYKEDVTLENNNDKYHLYQIDQTFLTSTINNGQTIDKSFVTSETEGTNVKYTTYNIQEDNHIVSVMATTENMEILQEFLKTMGYNLK